MVHIYDSICFSIIKQNSMTKKLRYCYVNKPMSTMICDAVQLVCYMYWLIHSNYRNVWYKTWSNKMKLTSIHVCFHSTSGVAVLLELLRWYVSLIKWVKTGAGNIYYFYLTILILGYIYTNNWMYISEYRWTQYLSQNKHPVRSMCHKTNILLGVCVTKQTPC